jgi:hypothetical protein
MRIFENGNVAIGRTSASVKLELNGSIAIANGQGYEQYNTIGTKRRLLQLYTDNNTYLDSADGDFIFRTKSGTSVAEAIRVKGNSQNVGIGTTNPKYKLEVNGNFSANNTQINGNATISGNVTVLGNLSVKRPYGMFSSTETQNMTSAGTPKAITFNWTEKAYQISLSDNNTNITFEHTGEYLVEISAIVSTNNNNKHIEIWVQKNGINLPRSNTRPEIENAGTEQIISVPFYLDVNSTNDKYRLMMASDDIGSLLVYTTNTSYSPESPSIIMTVGKVSEVS